MFWIAYIFVLGMSIVNLKFCADFFRSGLLPDGFNSGWFLKLYILLVWGARSSLTPVSTPRRGGIGSSAYARHIKSLINLAYHPD